MDLSELQSLLDEVDPKAASALERASAFERDEWVLIYRWEVEHSRGESLYAVLVQGAEIQRSMQQAGHDHQPGDGQPGFVTLSHGAGDFVTCWELVGEGELVPLAHVRHYNDAFPTTVELTEDFRLCFDLYEDTARREFVTVDEVGDRITAAKWVGQDLFVAKRFLRRYQAARQLSLVLQFCVDRDGGEEIQMLDALDIDVRTDTWRVAYHGSDGRLGEGRYFTRLVGKRLVPPPPIEHAGMYPYADPPQYEDFIIGTDAEGRPVVHTCDPDRLANYFGKNPGAPHYLTPVYFRPEVLKKYYADPDRYAVEDGLLRAANAFMFRLDNGRQDQIAAFLGDLGSDLPYREQQYWRSFNIEPTDGLSETAIRRSFLGQFAESGRVEHQFLAAFERLKAAWHKKFGWHLYSALHDNDMHLTRSLHVPTNPSLSEFGEQIVRLATLAVDYLAKKSIVAATEMDVDAEGSISKLERFLVEQHLPTTTCDVLRRIQGARSRAAAHRKGSDFDLDVLLDGNEDPPALFCALLSDLTSALDNLAAAVEA